MSREVHAFTRCTAERNQLPSERPARHPVFMANQHAARNGSLSALPLSGADMTAAIRDGRQQMETPEPEPLPPPPSAPMQDRSK